MKRKGENRKEKKRKVKKKEGKKENLENGPQSLKEQASEISN